VGLAVWLAGPLDWGVYGVAAAGAIVLTAKNALYTPAYAAWVLNQPLTTFARAIVPPVLATLIVAAGVWGLAEWLGVTTLLGTVVLAAAAAAGSGLLIVAVFLDADDRRTLGLRRLRGAA
jgi:membrane protein EpsK